MDELDELDDVEEESEPDADSIGPGGTVKTRDLMRVLFLEVKRLSPYSPQREYLIEEIERESISVTEQMIKRSMTAPGTRRRPTVRNFTI